MKQMYLFTLFIIMAVTLSFLFLSNDENAISREFLSSYGIEASEKATASEEFIIPEVFDSTYDSYNLLQLESGLDLLPYRGKKAVRKTFEITNFPESGNDRIFVDVILVNHRPVAGDINNPSISGFLLPLSYMLSN